MEKDQKFKKFFDSILIFLIYYHLFWTLNSVFQILFLANDSQVIYYSLNIVSLFTITFFAYFLYKKFVRGQWPSFYLLITVFLSKGLLLGANMLLGRMMFKNDSGDIIIHLIDLNQTIDIVWLIFNASIIVIIYLLIQKDVKNQYS